MATDQRTLNGNWATDADFRSWGSGLSAQFAAIGIIKTTDTGQIDWTTVLKPSAAPQIRGYEIWRFNDALQATKPVFIKIEFGSAATLSWPSLTVTIGTGTNGAGTLIGQIGPTRTIASNTSSGTTSYCSGSSSRLNLVTNYFALASGIVLCVERTKTGAGVETSDCIVRLGWSNISSLGYSLLPFIGVVPADTTVNPALDSNVGGVSALGADVMLCPTVVIYGKPLFASWCIYKTTEITALTPITFTHLGATRTYLPLGAPVGSITTLNLNAASGYSLAMLWE